MCEEQELDSKYFNFYTINNVFEKISHSIISYELLDNKLQLVFDFELVNLSDIVKVTKEDITWFHVFLKDKLGNSLGDLNITVKDPMFEISQGQGVPDIWIAVTYEVVDITPIER